MSPVAARTHAATKNGSRTTRRHRLRCHAAVSEANERGSSKKRRRRAWTSSRALRTIERHNEKGFACRRGDIRRPGHTSSAFPPALHVRKLIAALRPPGDSHLASFVPSIAPSPLYTWTPGGLKFFLRNLPGKWKIHLLVVREICIPFHHLVGMDGSRRAVHSVDCGRAGKAATNRDRARTWSCRSRNRRKGDGTMTNHHDDGICVAHSAQLPQLSPGPAYSPWAPPVPA